MSDPEDRELEDYLHRKSALSLGYKKVYVEAPPPELDRAVTARARRALRWLGPAVIAAAIAIGLGLMLNASVSKFMNALVSAERQKKELAAQQPVNVDIVMNVDGSTSAQTASGKISREQWLTKIKALRDGGKAEAADAEQAAFDKAFGGKKSAPAK